MFTDTQRCLLCFCSLMSPLMMGSSPTAAAEEMNPPGRMFQHNYIRHFVSNEGVVLGEEDRVALKNVLDNIPRLGRYVDVAGNCTPSTDYSGRCHYSTNEKWAEPMKLLLLPSNSGGNDEDSGGNAGSTMGVVNLVQEIPRQGAAALRELDVAFGVRDLRAVWRCPSMRPANKAMRFAVEEKSVAVCEGDADTDGAKCSEEICDSVGSNHPLPALFNKNPRGSESGAGGGGNESESSPGYSSCRMVLGAEYCPTARACLYHRLYAAPLTTQQCPKGTLYVAWECPKSEWELNVGAEYSVVWNEEPEDGSRLVIGATEGHRSFHVGQPVYLPPYDRRRGQPPTRPGESDGIRGAVGILIDGVVTAETGTPPKQPTRLLIGTGNWVVGVDDEEAEALYKSMLICPPPTTYGSFDTGVEECVFDAKSACQCEVVAPRHPLSGERHRLHCDCSGASSHSPLDRLDERIDTEAYWLEITRLAGDGDDEIIDGSRLALAASTQRGEGSKGSGASNNGWVASVRFEIVGVERPFATSHAKLYPDSLLARLQRIHFGWVVAACVVGCAAAMVGLMVHRLRCRAHGHVHLHAD